jgi:hypothetical protein
MQAGIIETKKIGILESEIVSALLYFDIFNYPLTQSEIASSIKLPTDPAELSAALSWLLDLKVLAAEDGFFFPASASALNVTRRKKGNRAAQAIFPRALKAAKRISKFPFVEGVCISGSLSKNYFDDKSDVDFFIISKPGRLWISRTFLVLFKKIFLLNSKKFFCVNYFVDTRNLEIPDRNIFTATEISSLKPVFNFGAYRLFREANTWTNSFLPFASASSDENCLPARKYFIKACFEKLFSGSFGDWADNLFFRTTLKRWKKKFPHFNTDDFDLNMRSRKSVSKHHPNGFQQKVLCEYEKKLRAFKEKFATID